jgi:hypothetical protein
MVQEDSDIFNENLSEDDRKWISTHGTARVIPENDKILIEGKSPTEIYFITKGLFAIIAGKDERFMLVGPGSLIGAAPYLTKTTATASVSAIERSEVIAISVDEINRHLTEDTQFALRFFQITANLLSKRLETMIASLIASPQPKNALKKSPIVHGPISLFSHSQPDFDLIERLLGSTPSVSEIFKSLQKGGNCEDALMQREKSLSVATMSAASLKLLWKVAQEEGLDNLYERVVRHGPSITARDTQALLKESCIQKTVTILIEDQFILCSSIGDAKIPHQILRKIRKMLGLPRSGFNSYINPNNFVPEVELGLLRGIVSTFFPPGRLTQLSQVVLITPEEELKQEVAISLSPFESLLIPASLFPRIAIKYAQTAYPYIPFEVIP